MTLSVQDVMSPQESFIKMAKAGRIRPASKAFIGGEDRAAAPLE